MVVLVLNGLNNKNWNGEKFKVINELLLIISNSSCVLSLSVSSKVPHILLDYIEDTIIFVTFDAMLNGEYKILLSATGKTALFSPLK